MFEHQEPGCPYCAAQLQGFRAHVVHLRREGVQVVALSERGHEPTRRWPWQARPLLEMFSGEAVTRLLYDVGQDVDEAGTRLHSTAAVVRPDGTVELALYDSGPQGHLSPIDAFGLILSQR
ncbi:hypothetical protein E7T06_20520 [Deinococcus sp. Arct2-2]|nr:hypothetical protein E7T06_20520 [Deinococcus sp. Arct2-2]